MSDRESFEIWFAGLRNVSVDVIRSMRSGDGYESFCFSLDGIYLAWASWKASKNQDNQITISGVQDVTQWNKPIPHAINC